MRGGSILALDIATVTGVAFGDPTAGLPALSSVRFGDKGDSLEASFAAAIAWTEEVLGKYNPRRIVFEAPLSPSFASGHTSANTARKLMGLPACIGGTAHRLGFFNIAEAPVADIRGWFLGTRRMRRAAAKAATIARCKELGATPRGGDQADAAALWCFAAGLYPAQSEFQLRR